MSNCGIANDTKYFVQTPELCSFKALYKLETYGYSNSLANNNLIFSDEFINNDNSLNYLYREDQGNKNNYIYKYNSNNKKDLCYPIENNEWNINCVIQTNNPFFTYNSANKSCSLIKDINLPKGFIFKSNPESNYLYYNNDEFPKYKYKNKKGFCENKWYDWIVTPNYHFGNQYEKDTGVFSTEDIRKCYKPCIQGYMPYLTTNNEYICIPKNEAEDGIYSKKLDYSPIALINLIGNSSSNLSVLYNNLLEYKKINAGDYKEFDSDLNYDKTAIINEGLNAIINAINTNIINEKSMNVKNLDNNTTILSYKNPYFNENDEELITLRGMETTEMLNDIILVHTYYLAKNYENFLTNIIKKILDAKIVDDYNIVYNNEYNIKYNIKNINSKQYQRLANILYKAINLCYDEKTDFSRNLLDLTKIAFNSIKTKINYYNEINNIDKIDKIDKIEIIFVEDFSDNYIINNIPNTKLKETMIETLEYTDRFYIYTLETIEIKNSCEKGQIKDKDSNKCQNCNTYCTKETCNTDPKCKIFCESNCLEATKEDKQKCGVSKKPSKFKKINDNNEIKLPFEEEYNIPSFSVIITNSIKLFLALIFIYICYVFFQIYGETILTIYNMLESFLVYLFSYLKNIILSVYDSKYNIVNAKYEYAEYARNNAVNKFERVSSKIKNNS